MSSEETHKLEAGTMSSVAAGDADETELARMGYKQELR